MTNKNKWHIVLAKGESEMHTGRNSTCLPDVIQMNAFVSL